MKRIVSLLLENQPGALSRVVGLFSQRGYNIESLTVSPTDDPTLSRLNITTDVDEKSLEQIEKQLHKLIDVLKVMNITECEYIEREVVLVKVKASTPQLKDELKRIADIFRGQIVDMTAKHYTIQVVGDSSKVDAFVKTVNDSAEIIETASSGIVGIARGERAMKA